MKVMFEVNNIIEPIIKLSEYYDSKYLIELIKKYNNKEKLDKIDYEYLILNYIKCKSNIRIIFSFEKYNIENVYSKELKMNTKEFVSLFINMMKPNEIKKYLYKNEKNIYIYFIDEIKNEIKNEIIYETNTFEQTMEIAELVLNENSLKFLKERSFDFYKFTDSVNRLMTFKKLLYANFDLKDLFRFRIDSGTIMLVYGLRPSRDIDFHILPYKKDMKQYNKNFINKVDKYFYNPKTKLEFANFLSENIGKYKDFGHWTCNYPHIFCAENINEVSINPRFHFHFLGLKFISLNGFIAERYDRIVNEKLCGGYVDLLLLNEKMGLKLELPELEVFKKGNSIKKNLWKCYQKKTNKNIGYDQFIKIYIK